MKNVRLFYKKTGNAKFISHLDTMRAMTRLLRRAGIPVWYTEGFNPHLYITFALPLSLGFESQYEIADIRLNDDDFPLDLICEKLNGNSPEGFCFFAASEPQTKLSALAFAVFRVEFEDGGELYAPLKDFLASREITVEKKTKRGDIKTMNVAGDIKDFSISKDADTLLSLTLPAGNQKNINPELIINKFLSTAGRECFVRITRLCLLDGDLKPVK